MAADMLRATEAQSDTSTAQLVGDASMNLFYLHAVVQWNDYDGQPRRIIDFYFVPLCVGDLSPSFTYSWRKAFAFFKGVGPELQAAENAVGNLVVKTYRSEILASP